MAELLLVRHAPTDWTGRRYCGRSDPGLGDAGRAAAARLAEELAPSLSPGLRIVSSPLLRARQTAAAILAATPGATLEADDRWVETDFGIAEGLTFEELELVAPGLAARLANGDPAIDWPEGEPAAMLAARVVAALEGLAALAGPMLVVSHAGPLRIAIALATHRPVADVAVPPPASVWRLPEGLPGPGLRRSPDPGPPR